jgi:hypothetical protein
MKLKQRLSLNDLAVHYQQALEKSNLELESARKEIQMNTEKIKVLEAAQQQPKKKKSKKNK